MKISASLQKLLPFGYLFLVILGIFKESVYYYQVGINILRYSTIMDILISPIADLTSHPVILGAVVLVIIFSYTLPTILSKQSHKKWGQKLAGLKKSKEELTEEEVENHFTNLFIKYLGICLLSFFVGIGIGSGRTMAKKIVSNQLSYDYKVTYGTGESEEVCKIGSNSVYYFFLSKGNKAIKITPVGAIKSIELLNNKMLK